MKCIPLILSYNHVEITIKSVNSVLNHYDYKINNDQLPIVLIHNGSLLKCREQLIKLFPTIDHLIIEENRGYSGGLNTGIQYAILKYSKFTPWILFLSNDCELLQWPSSSQVINLERTGTLLLAPVVWSRKTIFIDSVGGILKLDSGVPSHLKSSEMFQQTLKNPTKNQILYIPGSAFLIHQEIFNKLSGFNEAFGTYWEDIDFSIRAQEIGYHLGEISSFQVKHKIGKTCHKNSYYTTYLYQRNRKWVSRYYVKGFFFRLKLECHLWSSWIRLFWRLFKSKRYADIQKLIHGILEKSPL